MGAQNVTPSRAVGPERGGYWAIVDRNGTTLDALAVMERLYGTWRRCAAETAERAVRVIRHLGDDADVVGGVTEVEVRRRRRAVYRWSARRCTRGLRYEVLCDLEDLAYAVLAAEPVDAVAYRRWADGGDDARPMPAAALAPRSDLPADVADLLDPFMVCYRESNRAVGPY